MTNYYLKNLFDKLFTLHCNLTMHLHTQNPNWYFSFEE